MSSIVLLDSEGRVARKLHFVSLPEGYVVPEGMTVSWRVELQQSSQDPVFKMLRPKRPVEANFYLGSAWGRVDCGGLEESPPGGSGWVRYFSRKLTITVQGTSSKDVMRLRDHIMQVVTSGVYWEAVNDLNPKNPLHRVKEFLGMK